jgi:glycosyltransferase involved in cell wall biosynthesis
MEAKTMKNTKKMETKPLVSVVMPAYNSEKTIGRAIESILNQTYTNFEFIIVDDGSTDRTLEIIKCYAKRDKRIIVLNNEKNMKIVYSLNKGIEKARGEYIARMDSDDFSFPNRFEKQIKFLGKNPDVGVVGSNILLSKNGKIFVERKYSPKDAVLRKKIFFQSPFAHPSTMILKSALENYKYNERWIYIEDQDLWFKIGRKWKFANISEPLLKYNLNESGSSSQKIKQMVLNTFKLRWKYRKEKQYNYSLFAIIYNFSALIFSYIFPAKFIRWAFEKIRN